MFTKYHFTLARMWKTFLLPAVCCLVFAACGTAGNNDEDDEEEGGKNKKVSSRDMSITPEVAYTDLFLDSNVVAAFVDSLDARKKVKRRIISFYNARNYQYAWFASDGLTEQARGFYNLYLFDAGHNHDSLLIDKKLKQRMDNLFAEHDMKVTAANQQLLATELQLTSLFIQHGLEAYEDGYVKRKEMERFIPTRKVEPIYIADSLINKKHKDNKYFEDISEPYRKLKEQLVKYVDIAKKGGWPAIQTSQKNIQPGDKLPEIITIKQRLYTTGHLNIRDTTNRYDAPLEAAVKTYQANAGLTPDGIITQSLIKHLNVPAAERVKQILINLDRMRWMPSLPQGDMILVNIPEFVLHVMQGPTKVWDMNVVVGKEGHTTMMFTDDLNQVVFSPYWNVPPSIVRNEIMPKMAANPGYLASQNMEVVKDGNPPVIRQLPGPGNALGKVKFLFPNTFNIYFHDTPSKSLFNRDKRAFSHGCIRLSDPQKMAEYLLRNNPEWTPATIRAAMNSGTEKFVKLKKPVPVFITYYTAWVDEAGQLNFRDDIYNHDKTVAAKRFI